MLGQATMTKDLIFKLRLEDDDRKRLETIADHRGVSSAQVIRDLIKQEATRLTGERAYRIVAWDGEEGIAPFWFGDDREVAVERAKALARAHENTETRWKVFRVYKAEEEEPIYRAAVAHGATPTARRKTRVDNLAATYAEEDERRSKSKRKAAR